MVKEDSQLFLIVAVSIFIHTLKKNGIFPPEFFKITPKGLFFKSEIGILTVECHLSKIFAVILVKNTYIGVMKILEMAFILTFLYKVKGKYYSLLKSAPEIDRCTKQNK